MIESYIKSLPEELQACLQRYWSQYENTLIEKNQSLNIDNKYFSELIHLWVCSDYAAKLTITHPEWLDKLLNSDDLKTEYSRKKYIEQLQVELAEISSEEGLMLTLRRFRQYHMLRIYWRDLNDYVDVWQTMRELSDMADACVQASVEKLHQWLKQQHGMPLNSKGEEQNLIVVAMGKLGARELNLSSDIDLIFFYPERGHTQGSHVCMDNGEFFTELGRQLIKILNSVTADGFVFRVDMRLRPYGDAGPLVMSFKALENYYQGQGRAWERYAFVKARPITGDFKACRKLNNILYSFVYRRYLDYGVLEELRQLKHLINREIETRNLHDNVKLGVGGIREIEFIVQAQQLIHGGQQTFLRERSLRKALGLLETENYIKKSIKSQLLDAYVFLRNVEHRIQAFSDQQTHDLPKDEMIKSRLAYAMNCSSWEEFHQQLVLCRDQVQLEFNQTVEEQKYSKHISNQDEKLALYLQKIWQQVGQSNKILRGLKRLGYKKPEQVMDSLARIQSSRKFQRLGDSSKKKVQEITAILMVLSRQSSNPDLAYRRVLNFIEAVISRSSYINFLFENFDIITNLVTLCGESEWIADHLQSHPVLLDALRYYPKLNVIPNVDVLNNEVRQSLLSISAADLDRQMDSLHHFKQIQMLRIAAADVNGELPIMKVSDHLTMIAEIILQQVQILAWQTLVERHGSPGNAEFAIVGYGKLGGLELGYSSDLDLVFLHDQENLQEMTDGVKPISYGEFFSRLGQRIIHILNTRTGSGYLYDVDLQLRPSGSSGLLVASMAAFEKYQENNAWSWEHQALVRARMLTGSKNCKEKFTHLREHIIRKKRNRDDLTNGISEMRQRMRANNRTCLPDSFDLKYGEGGIIDIEFIVQYLALLWSHRYSELITYTDNIRILEAIGSAHLLPENTRKKLSDAYIAYRNKVHHLTLQKQRTFVNDDEFIEYRELVKKISRQLGLQPRTA